MENFSLTGASGWQTLASLLVADPTFKAIYIWSGLIIRNTHAANTMIIKVQTSTPAGGDASGVNLTAVGGTYPVLSLMCGSQGTIDGKNVWIKCSGASTTFDVTIIRKPGIGA
jgi:hypothetical protein